jgi:NAD-specific glutamate dehydrogenase
VISAYHPQANGLVERENRNILSGLRKLLQDPSKDWDVSIYTITSANNANSKRAHNWLRSPFELMFWRHRKINVPSGRDINEKATELDSLSDEDVEKLLVAREEKLQEIQQTVLGDAKKHIVVEQVCRLSALSRLFSYY